MSKPAKPLPWWLHGLIVSSLVIPTSVAFIDMALDTGSQAVMARAGLLFCLMVLGFFALITTWRFPKWRLQPGWAFVRYALAFGASIGLSCGAINLAMFIPSKHDRELDLENQRKRQFQHEMVKVERWWHKEPEPTRVVVGVEITAGADCRLMVTMSAGYTDDVDAGSTFIRNMQGSTEFREVTKGQRFTFEQAIDIPPGMLPAPHYGASFRCNDLSVDFVSPAPADEGNSGDYPQLPLPPP